MNKPHSEATKARISAARKTHGLTRTPEYISWIAAIGRTENQNDPAYPRYGGRGIKMIARWRNSFMAFLVDMGKRPTPEHSLDRINNQGDYEPGNCRWSTPKEQANNRRDNRTLTFGGRTMRLQDWARELGIARSSLEDRLKRWPLEKALTARKQPSICRRGDPLILQLQASSCG